MSRVQIQLAEQIRNAVDNSPWLRMYISTSIHIATRILELLGHDDSVAMPYEIVFRHEDAIIDENVFVGQINSNHLNQTYLIRVTVVLHANFNEPTNQTFMASAIYQVAEEFEIRKERLNVNTGELNNMYLEYCL